MMAAREASPFEPKAARHKYETLRANALGNASRAIGFSVFLRNGMSGWLDALAEQNCVGQKVRPEISLACREPNVGMPAVGLASILTDAILNAGGRPDTSEAAHE
jgi:hypothetical protein